MSDPAGKPLSSVPKFQQGVVMPTTLDEWGSFIKWLTNARNAINYVLGSIGNVEPASTPPNVEGILAQVIGRLNATRPPQIPGYQPTIPASPPLIPGYGPTGRPTPPFPTVAQFPPLLDDYANWTATNYPPAIYPPGQTFFIEDWGVLYVVENVAGTLTWVYQAGVYIAATASRPTTGFDGGALGANDAGFLFIDSTLKVLEYWTGSAWVNLSSSFTPNSFTPVIEVGGSATGVAFTSIALSTISGSGTGAPVTLVINVTITGWPGSPSGAVTISGLPTNADDQSVGEFAAVSGFVGLTAGVPIIPVILAGVITLYTQGATGLVALDPTKIAVASQFTLTIQYQST
jgi:hypothetical protein